MRYLTFPIIILLLSSVLCVADVVMWKDAKGRINYGDNPPAQYRESARGVDLENLNTMPVNEANERFVKKLDRERAWLKRRPVNILDMRKNKAKTEKPYNKMSCAEKKNAFRKAQACFASCKTVTGERKGWNSMEGSPGGKSGINSRCAVKRGCTDVAQPNC